MEAVEKAKTFLEGLLGHMGIEGTVETTETDEKVSVNIETEQAEIIIGKRGRVMDALQHLVSKVVYKERAEEKRKPIVVDVAGYRERQAEKLQQLAERMSDKAKETGEVVHLRPMNSYDRRLVHMALSEIDGIRTESEGQGEDRHITIIPD